MNSPAPEPNLLALFARPLHEAGLRYLIAGSVGAMHYSEPRLTIDIPILLPPRVDFLEESLKTPAPWNPAFYSTGVRPPRVAPFQLFLFQLFK